MPSYVEHGHFVLNHPYRAWFLVFADQECIGSVYLNMDNTVGFNVREDRISDCFSSVVDIIKRDFEPLPPVKSVRDSCFVISVPPSNKALMKEIKSRNYSPIQIMYVL